MDALQRAGERKHIAHVAPASFSGGETKNRSQPFTACEKAVTHRSVQGRGFRVRFRQVAIERAFDQLLARDEIRFDVHGSVRSMLDPGCCARLIIQYRALRIQHRVSDAMRCCFNNEDSTRSLVTVWSASPRC